MNRLRASCRAGLQIVQSRLLLGMLQGPAGRADSSPFGKLRKNEENDTVCLAGSSISLFCPVGMHMAAAGVPRAAEARGRRQHV